MEQIKESETFLEKITANSLDSIILNSQYTCLVFWGRSDGSQLVQNFNQLIIRGKRILIKSIRILPYAFADSDVFYNATTGDHYTVPGGGRLINVVDDMTTSARIEFFINEFLMNFFPTYIGTQGYPLDLFLDNIYYNFKEKVESLRISVDGNVYTDLSGVAQNNPWIKLLVECYLY